MEIWVGVAYGVAWLVFRLLTDWLERLLWGWVGGFRGAV